jgi:hypothetical protein
LPAFVTTEAIMSTRSPRTSATHEPAQPGIGAFGLFADLPRRQLALMTHSATALFRGSEDMRRIQQQTAQRATEHHEEAAERLRGQCDFNDLLAIQADLVRFDVQEAMRYWQQLANAAFKLQADMVTSAGEAVLEGASEPSLDSLQRAFEATLNSSGAAATTH